MARREPPVIRIVALTGAALRQADGPERRTAVRSLVGVALDVLGVSRDGFRLPREARR